MASHPESKEPSDKAATSTMAARGFGSDDDGVGNKRARPQYLSEVPKDELVAMKNKVRV
jgi:hypothetical protein